MSHAEGALAGVVRSLLPPRHGVADRISTEEDRCPNQPVAA
jgi:hypothetical protein